MEYGVMNIRRDTKEKRIHIAFASKIKKPPRYSDLNFCMEMIRHWEVGPSLSVNGWMVIE